MPRGSQFKTNPRRRLRRSKLDLSHERRLTCDPFFLIPILVDDCIPGDHWKIGNEIIIRCNPLITPIMHEINCYVHYYFVPYRILWDDWEDFTTGGRDGKFTAAIPKLDTTSMSPNAYTKPGGLYDHLFGHVLGPNFSASLIDQPRKWPVAFPKYAYNMIYNEFYRDQNLVDEIDITTWVNNQTSDLHIRCWEKDYFTSMLPWQQRGEAPAFPIEGNLNVTFPPSSGVELVNPAYSPLFTDGLMLRRAVEVYTNDGSIYNITTNTDVQDNHIIPYFNKGTVNLQNAVTFGVSELRLGFQIQRFLERMARTGARYTEYLKGIFGTYPRDDRLQRPEYIGGSKTPIIVSEVLQTSSSDTTSPQGNMAGHGISANRTYVGSYRVQEHGLIMGIMSIMPRTLYQQGLDRVWIKDSRFDYYLPEFQHLSEQAVDPAEIFNRTGAPAEILGYQGRYDEYRFKRNSVHGLFREDLDFWHMGRKFATHPQLNLDLVRPSLSEIQAVKRVLAVPEEDMFLVSIGNRCHVTRPMSWMAIPGLIDHG